MGRAESETKFKNWYHGDNQSFQNFMEWLKLKQKVSEQIGRQKAIEGQRIGKRPTKSNTATAATHVTV
jgi:hypothetical protein